MSGSPSETTKLKGSPSDSTLESYGLADEEKGLQLADGVSGSYDINHMVTMRVFGVVQGTIFKSVALWKETALTAVLFWGIYAYVLLRRPENFRQIVGKESSIRAFIAMFSTLIGLLLSFYTALNLGRWWQMRMAANNVQCGSKKLSVMLTQITHDSHILECVNRYGRASLFLIFATSQMEEGEAAPRRKALEKGLLTEEEVRCLECLTPHMPFIQAETLWVWLANVVNALNDQGKVKGAPHYCALMAAIEQGRSAIEDIQQYLETPIPLAYVHLLCMMVKLHNFILTVLMAMACVMVSGGEHGFQPVAVFRTAFRAFFMPFLYNAILILNSEVTDPFGGDDGDFDWTNFDVNLAVSGRAFAGAIENVPDWVVADYKQKTAS